LEGAPITMLNADEKIRELNSIIKEQDVIFKCKQIKIERIEYNEDSCSEIHE
jgi:hypothetical protein